MQRKAGLMKRTKFLISLVVVGLTAALLPTKAAAEETTRKALIHPDPMYPTIMKQNSLGVVKIVKLQIAVSAQGAVTKATVVGGDAVLAQSALEAVRQWKYTPAETESTMVVEFRFHQ